MDRRIFIAGVLGVGLGRSTALAQSAPRLIFLHKGITSPLLSFAVTRPKPKREISLEGWLLCNGAEASRSLYQELFKATEPDAGPGDGSTTFNIPNLPCEYRAGNDPVKGWAVSWSEARFGFDAGTLFPFDVDQNL